MQTFQATTMLPHANTSREPYEFGREHEAILTRTAHWARQLGIVYGIAATFTFASRAIVPGAVQVVFAVLFIRFARDLRAIVETAGQDAAHLAAASRKLSGALRVRIYLLIFAVPIAAVGFAARLMQ